MTSALPLAFIPGTNTSLSYPLARYLPPLPPGVIREWLTAHVAPGSWILDPLGSQPLLALEAAQAGYRVLVASNNPILTFMVETLAAAPQREEFDFALAALGSSRRGEDRFERYMQSMYQTTCSSCGEKIQAASFVWQKDASQPMAKIYHCPHCGDEGEHAITDKDLEILGQTGSDALHRSRVLARVAEDATQTAQVEAALTTYASRSLILLNTLLNKADGLKLPPEKTRLLTALLISACDEANTLWPHPAARPRPRQLSVPAQYRENNLWLALENAISVWTSQSVRLPLTRWPATPPKAGGICLFPGRIRTLVPLPKEIQPAAIMSAIPRPNQAFWTLCALWSGWIWGREAVQPLRGSLERLRYDWYWMTQALHYAFTEINTCSPAGTPLWITAAELIPGYMLSLFCGPASAGYQMEGSAYEATSGLIQIQWSSNPVEKNDHPARATLSLVEKSLVQVLEDRAEPCDYLTLFSNVCTTLAEAQELPGNLAAVNPDWLARVQTAVETVLRSYGKFIHYSDSPTSVESGQWALLPTKEQSETLADRVERFLVNRLTSGSIFTLTDLYQSVYRQFSGRLTPGQVLMTDIVESYAQPEENQPLIWRLRPQDTPTNRRKDIQSMQQLLFQIAQRLGLIPEGNDPIFWKDSHGKLVFVFYTLASALISRCVEQPPPGPDTHGVILIPGSRAALISGKLQRDPRLRAQVNQGWRILKFRHLRLLSEREHLNQSLFIDLLDDDPLSWENATQIRLL